MASDERRALVTVLVMTLLLAAFVALALWGPGEDCVNVIDYCDAVV